MGMKPPVIHPVDLISADGLEEVADPLLERRSCRQQGFRDSFCQCISPARGDWLLVKRVSLAAIGWMGDNHDDMISSKTKIGLLVAAHVLATPATILLAWHQSWPNYTVLAWKSVSASGDPACRLAGTGKNKASMAIAWCHSWSTR